jgi:hypothetical protein
MLLPRKRIKSREYSSRVRGRAASMRMAWTVSLLRDSQFSTRISSGSEPVIRDS